MQKTAKVRNLKLVSRPPIPLPLKLCLWQEADIILLQKKILWKKIENSQSYGPKPLKTHNFTLSPV